MTVTRNLILQIIAIVIFAVVFCLTVLFKSAGISAEEAIGIVALGLAFHAAAHI